MSKFGRSQFYKRLFKSSGVFTQFVQPGCLFVEYIHMEYDVQLIVCFNQNVISILLITIS